MRNKLPIFVFAFSFALFVGCSNAGQILTIETDEGVHQFNVEVVITAEDKAQGLMGRGSLAENRGMLFVYEEEKMQSFWMKNMLIPLDILFIGSDLVINYISEDVPPCTTLDNCISYPSLQLAQYVLELSAGITEELDIDVGDRVIILSEL